MKEKDCDEEEYAHPLAREDGCRKLRWKAVRRKECGRLLLSRNSQGCRMLPEGFPGSSPLTDCNGIAFTIALKAGCQPVNKGGTALMRPLRMRNPQRAFSFGFM